MQNPYKLFGSMNVAKMFPTPKIDFPKSANSEAQPSLTYHLPSESCSLFLHSCGTLKGFSFDLLLLYTSKCRYKSIHFYH